MIKYYNKEETIKLILSEKYNYIRLGDGEFRIVGGFKCATPFQMIVPELKSKLEEIVKESNENKYKNLIIGIVKLQHKKEWYLNYMKKNMDCDQIYHETIPPKYFSSPILKNKKVVYISSYLPLSDITIEEDDNKLNLLKKIDYVNLLDIKDQHHPDIIRLIKLMKISDDWRSDFLKYYNELPENIRDKINNKKLQFSNKSVIHDIERFFSSVEHIKSKETIEKYFKKVEVIKVDYIETYFRFSFDQYDYILNKLLKYDKDWVFLFATGPAGKVIAMDLIKRGVTNRIYDFGQKI